MKLVTDKNNIEQVAIETNGNGSSLNGGHINGEQIVRNRAKKINGADKPTAANGISSIAAEETGKKAPATKKASAKKETAKKAPAKKAAAKKTATPKKEGKTTAVKKKAAEKPVAAAKAPVKKATSKSTHVTFQLKFHTKFGQTLYITGNHPIFGDSDLALALPMQYLNEEYWTASIELDKATVGEEGITYNYFIKYEDGTTSFDWGADKVLYASTLKPAELFIADAWNFAGYYENAFYTEPFKHVLLKNNYTPVKAATPKTVTHIFKVKAPLLTKGQTICITGSIEEIGNWDASKAVLLGREAGEDFFSVKLDLTNAILPVIYRYAVYDVEQGKIVQYEGGNNRAIYNGVAKNRQAIVNDGFAVLPNNTWKGAGVAIPVFSLRSDNSCGAGEFADIKLLVDWAKSAGLKLIQLLPVNDTTATHTWTDSYPYAAISAFALHPMYLHLPNVVLDKNKHLLQGFMDEKLRLNKLDNVDYEAVNALKWSIIKQVYPLQKITLFASDDYQQFFKQNEHWLVPYAAFCYFRDKHKDADFSRWPAHKKYDAAEIKPLLDLASKQYDDIAIHFFVQYHLHVQLKEATQYAHDNGVIVKGDIPIGVYRYGADAWQNPELYHMDMQAGAPPDDFAVTGQNWSFPTYNWTAMRESGFAWWKQRFEQMSYYFDAFRIDHILGFFRIWSIPMHAVEGILGHFEPAIPVYRIEFDEKDIWFDQYRYCKPYITDQVVYDFFGDDQNQAKHAFLNYDGFGNYQLKPDYATQRQVEHYFASLEDNAHNRGVKQGLFNLISNVILFEVEGSNGQQFHFRFGTEGTSSFRNLDGHTQHQLRELYVNYFFRRQDDFWKHKALQTLPDLKRVTNMLVCGEDLGMVPSCVPEVMKQLGLLSLEIQRMPKDSRKDFFHPADSPYLSVVTPSTHDMSTIRGWWEEDRNKTQKFYNYELGQWGDAPHFCEASVNKAIVMQHLYSPAMWSIFQMQDILGTDKDIRRENPHEERINVPAIPKYYWRYRMHITLEKLLGASEFNIELKGNIEKSGR